MDYTLHCHKNGAEESVLQKRNSLLASRDHARKLLVDGLADSVEIYDKRGRMVAQFQNMVRNA